MAHTKTRSTVGLVSVEIRIDETGRRRLFCTRPVSNGEVIVSLTGLLRPEPTRYSIQLDNDAHLDDLGLIEATNHDCEPSAFVDFSHADGVVFTALRDLPSGAEVTIDYCCTEEDMTSPFPCDCGSVRCRGQVQGFVHLDPAHREAIADRLSPYLRSKYVG